jgi:hypothetical protein
MVSLASLDGAQFSGNRDRETLRIARILPFPRDPAPSLLVVFNLL